MDIEREYKTVREALMEAPTTGSRLAQRADAIRALARIEARRKKREKALQGEVARLTEERDALTTTESEGTDAD